MVLSLAFSGRLGSALPALLSSLVLSPPSKPSIPGGHGSGRIIDYTWALKADQGQTEFCPTYLDDIGKSLHLSKTQLPHLKNGRLMLTSQVVRIQCRNHQELGRENERQSLQRAGSCPSLRKRPRGVARTKHEIVFGGQHSVRGAAWKSKSSGRQASLTDKLPPQRVNVQSPFRPRAFQKEDWLEALDCSRWVRACPPEEVWRGRGVGGEAGQTKSVSVMSPQTLSQINAQLRSICIACQNVRLGRKQEIRSPVARTVPPREPASQARDGGTAGAQRPRENRGWLSSWPPSPPPGDRPRTGSQDNQSALPSPPEPEGTARIRRCGRKAGDQNKQKRECLGNAQSGPRRRQR